MLHTFAIPPKEPRIQVCVTIFDSSAIFREQAKNVVQVGEVLTHRNILWLIEGPPSHHVDSIVTRSQVHLELFSVFGLTLAAVCLSSTAPALAFAVSVLAPHGLPWAASMLATLMRASLALCALALLHNVYT